MRDIQRGQKARFTFILLGIITLFFLPAFATWGQSSTQNSILRHKDKLSGILREEVTFLTTNPELDYTIPVIVRLNRDFFMENLNVRAERSSPARSHVLQLIHSYSARLTASQIRLLLSSELIEYITLDVPVQTTSSDTTAPGENPFLAAIGADQVSAAGYTGAGVTVAVFDSGIKSHPDLDPSRILVSVDFTSGSPVLSSRNSDDYGHGTAVAGVIGGTGKKSGGVYTGVAPGVNFVDVKVVGEDGTGFTSNLIKAIEWVIEHKDIYNIRVANFSIGHPPVESYTVDPLCQAVEQLSRGGILTVTSAGNLGKTTEYPKIWGAEPAP